MSATTANPITFIDEWVPRRLREAETDACRRAQCDQRDAMLSDLSGRNRMRALAGFLGCDTRAVVEGLVEAVERDPILRIQRL